MTAGRKDWLGLAVLALPTILSAGAASAGVAFLFSQYLQTVKGFSSLTAGLWLVPDTLGMIASSLLSPIVARRVRPGYVVAGGLGVSLLGFLVFTQVGSHSGVGLAVAGAVLVFFGITPSWVLGTDLMVSAAPPERAGSASSVSETGSELGFALGVAIFGAIGTAVTRVRTDDGVAFPDAFTSGLNVAGAVSAVAVGLLTVVAVVLLRHLRPTGEA